MSPNGKVKKLQSELEAVHKTVREMRSDKVYSSNLGSDDHQRVEEILSALHEDIQVLEKGAEVIEIILTGK